MSASDREIGYIRDLAYFIREKATDAKAQRSGDDPVLHEGRELAFREILSWMQHQADTFDIPRAAICLDGFDALVDPVEPPEPAPRDL